MSGPFVHPDGIYFGMSATEYHADPALGSSDLKNVGKDPTAFWWNSAMNPLRAVFAREETPAMMLGTAVHFFVLDGKEAFRSRYGRCAHNGSTKAGRSEREDLAFQNKIPLRGEDYDRISLAGQMIRSNPHVNEAFCDGQPEVSIFWTEEVEGFSVRRKARIDYLKVRAVVDLKSHDPMDGVTFKASCLRSIKTLERGIQAAAYLDARAAVARLYATGAVHGDHDAAWMERVAAATDFAFVLVFWARKGPPLTWGVTLSPSNEIVRDGKAAVNYALGRYVSGLMEFGADKPWIRPEPLQELDPDDVKNWWLVE